MTHDFKPYADCANLCVAELPNGDTCNQPEETHMSAMSDLDLQMRDALDKFDAMLRDKEQWIADNTNEYGDPDVDDEEWYDGIDHYNGELFVLGAALADLVRKSLA